MRGRGALVVAMALVAASDPACARDLAIPPCTLAEAIDIIARGTGASIGTTNPALLRRRVASKRVSGGVDNMLRQILGNGVLLRRLGGDAWLIVGLRRREADPVSAPVQLRAPVRSPEPSGAPIVVTGTRSDATLRAVPITAQVMPGAMIDAAAAMRGSDALADRVALLSGTHLGPGRDKLFLRGIADSSFAGTRAATVAPYLGAQRLTYRAPDPGLLPLDLEQVEVLPGPHGTLYGAGALGGIVRLQPRAPDLGETSAGGWGGVSATAHGAMGGDLGGLVNLPVAEGRLALRALGYRSDARGYIDDTARGDKDVNRVRTTGGRLALRYREGDWTADFGGTAQEIRSRDAQYAQPGSAGALARHGGNAEPSSHRIALVSATVRRDGGPVHVSATVGAVDQRVTQDYAATARDGAAVVFRQVDRASLLTAEARVWREAEDGPGWLGGVSVLSSRARQVRSVLPEDPDDRLRLRNDNTELNAFGEVTLDAGPALDFTGGLRLSRLSLDGDAVGKLDSFYFSREQDPVVVARSETRLLPSLAATLRLRGAGRAYARYERGYRPGGVAAGIVSRKFASDRIDTLEFGLRALRTGPLEWDAAVAWSLWRDVQGDLLTPEGLTYTENIGDARVLSADVAVRAQATGRLQLLGAAMLVHDRLHPLEYLRDGSRSLPNVPGLSLRGEARYRLPLGAGRSLGLDALVVHEGVSHLGSGANLDLRQGPVTRLDLAGRLDLGGVALALSVENLLDARDNRFALGNPFTLRAGAQTTPQRPRTVRVGFEAGF